MTITYINDANFMGSLSGRNKEFREDLKKEGKKKERKNGNPFEHYD